MMASQEHEWSEHCQTAFEQVKHALTHAPVLSLPDFTKPFEVICDASIEGLGAVLLQEERPLAFESRKLVPAERNYTTGEQELLAVVHALKTWRCYLEGQMFTVITDHNPLVHLNTQPNLSPAKCVGQSICRDLSSSGFTDQAKKIWLTL